MLNRKVVLKEKVPPEVGLLRLNRLNMIMLSLHSRHSNLYDLLEDQTQLRHFL
jgi:hypothetical protein